MKKQNKEKISVPKSAQDLIDIDTLYKDGIFCSKNKYSKTYRFKDINYSIASKDEKVGLFLNYSELLNSLDSSTMTKITINNRKINIKEFKEMTEEWLDFIVACRSGKTHDYDIVIGAMADDQIYTYVSDYIDGTITREQFWVLAKFKYPTHLIVFCTDEALKCLTYRGFEEVH